MFKSKNPSKILVRVPNWLGDCVMATPLFKDLKSKWPHASLHVLAQGISGELLQANPYIDKIISFLPNEKSQIPKKIKEEKYDLGILLTNSFSSAYMFWKAKIKKRLGFKGQWRRFFLNIPSSFPQNKEKQHLILTYKALLKPLEISESTTKPTLYLTEQEKKTAAYFLESLSIPPNAKIIGINPGAAYGSAKCWLPERFKQVAEKLLEDPSCWIVFFGDKNGASLVDEICHGMPNRCINLAGKTKLRELIALIDKCQLFLTNDSGPMHIAAALEIPLVALFGSTNEIATGPYQWGSVIHKHVSCSPCYLRTCPIDFKCMKRIQSEEVLSLLKKNLRF